MSASESLNLTNESKYRALVLAALGGVLENYDFIVFALFARVIGQLFFPPQMPEWLAITQTFGIFAAGNLARPLGGLVLAHYGDLLGRKRTFVFSMMLMSAATLGIACAPTYATIGSVAPIILLTMRIIQGVAMGGELPGAWTFVAEQVAAHRVGFACSVLSGALSMGNLLAAVAGVTLTRFYKPAEILAFGWRLPFFAGAIIAIIAAYVRRSLVETPVFRALQREGKLATELPLRIVLRRHLRGVVASAALTSLSAVTIVVMFVMTPTLLQTNYSIGISKSFQAVSLATACLGVSCICCGLLANILGVDLLLIGGTPVLAACVYIFFTQLAQHPDKLFALYALASTSVGVIAGIPSMFVQSFPPAVRYTGVAFSYNVAYAVFSGTTPPLIALVLRVDPLAHAHAVMLACAVVFVIAAARLINSRTSSFVPARSNDSP
ncbi:MFS transporter [Bradyrhizobium sp. Ai1a-2]|uniref:MFS transporter n=1 Tax=Bradyrhizobium sp. Ai1a-2 TaxID=196490 RepID=UPI000407F229|nr:MFS transporter [Bradyrhizobium sp. Ai1a-2]